MIEVNRLTKYYGPNRGIEEISFSVEKGEILGVLGPNGAGKSTLFRILTGFMPATGGSVRIAGLDVFRDSLAVRRLIGYMPENVPLYPEMRIYEYLDYRARLKEVPRRQRLERLESVMEQCGILDVRRRIIGQLSKGYRQRLGLAATLVHNPDIIILDEPTIGLDPNQIREVRHLIKSLAGNHTVLLSSHILSEVEMICEEVLIMNEGRVLAIDSTEHLRNTAFGIGSTLQLEVKGKESKLRTEFSKVDGLQKVQIQLDGKHLFITIESRDARDLREPIFHAVLNAGGIILEMHSVSVSLEDVFIKLTADEAEPAETTMTELTEEEISKDNKME